MNLLLFLHLIFFALGCRHPMPLSVLHVVSLLRGLPARLDHGLSRENMAQKKKQRNGNPNGKHITLKRPHVETFATTTQLLGVKDDGHAES